MFFNAPLQVLLVIAILCTAAALRYLVANLQRFSTSAPGRRFPAVFTDFDGTITTLESDRELWKKLGMSSHRLRSLKMGILNGTITMRQAFQLMVEEVSEKNTFKEVLQLATETYVFDPAFREFYDWCKVSGIPIFVVSNGLTPIIRVALEGRLGVKDASRIRIIANDVEVDKNGKFSMIFRHPDSTHGLVKSRAMDEFRLPFIKHRLLLPYCIFVGNGVGDSTAAHSADRLFVKVSPNQPNDLAVYCRRESIPFVPFTDFAGIKLAVEKLVEETATS